MDDAALEFFRKILETPSPSGYERPVQDIVRRYIGPFADKVTTDSHGNVIAVKNPGAGPGDAGRATAIRSASWCNTSTPRVICIFSRSAAGKPCKLIGQRMTVWTTGGPMPGVIARKPIHLLTDEDRKQVPKLKDLWLDIGAKDKAEAAELVRVGDPVTLELGYQPLRNNLANSPAMDDKAGLWVVMEAFRRSKPQEAELRPVCRLDRAGRNRPARRADQRLRHRPARRHRRRRDARHRLPDDRQEAGGGHRAGQGPGDLSRAEHEPGRRRAADRHGQGRRRAVSNSPPAAAPRLPTPTRCKSAAPAWPPAW